MNLEPPDTHHVSAAIGWLELGNPQEAAEEIARLSPSALEVPEVMELRWSICAETRSWEGALLVAEAMVRKCPQRDSGWIHRAYALRRVKGGSLEKAWDALHEAYEKFPKISVIPYNLACYAAQMGRLEEAWEWLHTAMEVEGSVDGIKKMALIDTDLEALWDRVRAL